MNSPEYLEYHKQFCAKMHEITERKNHDYSGFEESAFGNFEVVERCGIASTEVGILTRIMDKISRINSFVIQGSLSVEDEKIDDTCSDACNYLIILSAYIKSKRNDNIQNNK